MAGDLAHLREVRLLPFEFPISGGPRRRVAGQRFGCHEVTQLPQHGNLPDHVPWFDVIGKQFKCPLGGFRDARAQSG